MRFFPLFVFLLWNLGVLCPIDAKDRNRELYFPAYYFFAERRLMKHRIRTMRVKDLDDCELLCYRDDNCVSLNIKDKDLDSGTHECELNNSTHLEHDGHLKSDPVYYYRGAKNACGKNRPQCENNGICQSGFTGKGYRCLCPLGFRGEHCEEDINECSINNGGCHANANCQFTLGSFSCTCKSGYEGNGLDCSDVDECSINNGGCNADAICHNTEGSFTCTCKPGYSWDGSSCVDIDECISDVHDCHISASCTNTVGSYSCSCNVPYTGDGKACWHTSSECEDYEPLEDGNRKTTYRGHDHLCDDSLGPGWFRFQGAAGTKMPTSCPPRHSCGTDAPGWLDGTHPTMAEDIVTRRVYFHWYSNCHKWPIRIEVKNCSSFYVYRFNRTPNRKCNLRYCGTD